MKAFAYTEHFYIYSILELSQVWKVKGFSCILQNEKLEAKGLPSHKATQLVTGGAWPQNCKMGTIVLLLKFSLWV